MKALSFLRSMRGFSAALFAVFSAASFANPLHLNTPYGALTIQPQTRLLYANGKLPNPTVKGAEQVELGESFELPGHTAVLVKQVSNQGCQGPFNFATISAQGARTFPTFGECARNYSLQKVNNSVVLTQKNASGVTVKYVFADNVLTANGRVIPATTGTHFYNQHAVINDPDGYTNMRSGPSDKHSILMRVDNDDFFLSRPQPGEWWKVSMLNGTEGYMHKSRIVFVQEFPY